MYKIAINSLCVTRKQPVKVKKNPHFKQKTHGPHRSHENQFLSINTFLQSYDYTLTLIERKKILISFIRIKITLYMQKLEIPQGCLVRSLGEIGPVVLAKIFQFPQCILSLYRHYFRWERVWHFVWTNLNYLHPRMFCVDRRSTTGDQKSSLFNLRSYREFCTRLLLIYYQ